MLLHGADLSPYTMRVVMQASFKGIDLPMTVPADRDGADYRALNPLGKLPTLSVGDRSIFESGAVCDYLEEVYPEPSLLPADPLDRAGMRVIERLFETYVMNAMMPLFKMLARADRVPAVVDRATNDIRTALAAVEARMGAPYVAGAAMTLADCMAVPTLLFVERFMPGFGLADPIAGHPALYAYWMRMQDDPVAAPILARMRVPLDAMKAAARATKEQAA